MTEEAHLEGSPARLATQADLEEMIGNTVIGHLSDGSVAEYFLRDRDHTIARIRSGYQRTDASLWDTRIEDAGLCFPNSCFRVFLWGDESLIVVDEAGNIAFRGEILPGDARQLQADLSS